MRLSTNKVNASVVTVTCKICQMTKVGNGNFKRNGNSKTGYEYRCKQCTKEGEQRWLARQEERRQQEAEEWRLRRRQRLEELQRGLEGREYDSKLMRRAGR